MPKPALRPTITAAALALLAAAAVGVAVTPSDLGSSKLSTTQSKAGLASAELQVERLEPSKVEMAQAVVSAAVRRAQNDAALPPTTSPALGSDLAKSRADLGQCQYGEPHNDEGGILCERGDRGSSRTLVVLGDSHGRHWVPGLEKYATSHGWSAYFLVKEQCTAAIVANGDPAQARPTAPWAACQKFREWALEVTQQLDPDVVIISTSTPTKGVFTSEGFKNTPESILGPYREGTRKLVTRLADTTDARIVMLRDVPARKIGTDPEPCFKKASNDQGDCLSPRDVQESRVRLISASVRAAKGAGAQIADPTLFFCWHGQCPVVVGPGLLPYRNTSHITVEYSRHLAPALGELLQLG